MAGFISIKKTKRTGPRFLRLNDSLSIVFSPQVGNIDAFVEAAVNFPPETPTPPIPPDPEPPQDPDGPVPLKPMFVRVEITLFHSGSSEPIDQKIVFGNIHAGSLPFLRFSVPVALAGGSWHCTFKNLNSLSVLLTPAVRFVKEIRRLETTSMPMRVLNHGLAQLVSAVGIRVHLDGDQSIIDFSPDLKKLSNGAIKPIRFSAPINDFNLSTLSVRVSGLSQRPIIKIFAQFETEGEEVDTTFVDVDLDKAAITIDLALDGAFRFVDEPLGRVKITPTAKVDISGDVGAFLLNLIPGVDIDMDDIRDALRDGIDKYLSENDNWEIIGDYLGRGFAQLAGFGHQFHDIVAAGSNIIVTHYDPNKVQGSSSGGGIISDAPPIDPSDNAISHLDTIAAKKINALGLSNLRKIDHIVVLMQENRSFDHMLGYLRKNKGRTDVEGLTGDETNSAPGIQPVKVNPLRDTRFIFSPNHEHHPVMDQIAKGTMSGFLQSFIERYPDVDFRLAMGHYTEDQVGTFDFLSEQFLICDQWFCSHPGPTQPNRFCALSGKTPVLDNLPFDSPFLGYLELTTLFERLTQANISWVYYEHDVAFLRLYDRYRLDNRHVIPFDDENEGFVARAANGTLPSVVFIDPDFVDIPPSNQANDDHPPADIKPGQEMIGCVYNALRNSPQWEKTLFIITYDEHGGFFDHVAPPGTEESKVTMRVPLVHPEGPGFFGARVPTFVISPFVAKRSVSSVVFDHTSIAKTILLRFLNQQLPSMGSRRLLLAQHLGQLLIENEARQDIPTFDMNCPPEQVLKISKASLAAPLPDDFHEAIRQLGRPNRIFQSMGDELSSEMWLGPVLYVMMR